MTSSGPNWYVDLGAFDHMSSLAACINNTTPFSSPNKVSFGNCTSLPISHIGHTFLHKNIHLRDVLVVPKRTKNLQSVSKLTYDNSLDVLFSHAIFYIQDRKTKQVLAQGRSNSGLYVLSSNPHAFYASTSSKFKASFDLWHARLRHVSYESISLLNKKGQLLVTSILLKPFLCSSCQMAKAHRLPFVNNEKRATKVLDLIHCDLWGPSPVCSVDSSSYYVVLVDDYSRFTWFYPLKTKLGFHVVSDVFLKFVQTHFNTKVKSLSKRWWHGISQSLSLFST